MSARASPVRSHCSLCGRIALHPRCRRRRCSFVGLGPCRAIAERCCGPILAGA